ncbi:MAG: glycosyltransferase family 2 protein [Rhodomicrobiaceae bacterium]
MAEQALQIRNDSDLKAELRAGAAPISCYIRTLNEERRIGEVIRGALQIADEVIVVDSGSKDETLAIARSEGARIIQQPWLGNGRQKRVGEDAARHEWVLDLDADEVVTPELAEEIRRIFASGPRHRMYELTLIMVPPFGKPWWRFKRASRIKLYDKRRVRIPDHAAWDQFDPPAGETVGRLGQPLLHYCFSDIGHMVTKLNRVSAVRAREAPLKARWQVILRVLFAFPAYFFKEYILSGLIRGGVYGFAFAMTVAIGRWLRDVKMYERHRQG